MTMNIRAQGFALTEALKDSTDAHLQLALGRFKSLVQRIEVSLSDINGAGKGGVDKRCLISLRLSDSKIIVIQETGRDMYDTIHACVRRTRHTLERHVGRKRKFERRSIRRDLIPLEAA